MFSNINRLRVLTPKIFYSGSEFLSYLFKYIIVNNVRYVSIPYSDSNLTDKFLSFFAILDNSQLSFLNKLFFDNNKYQ